MSIYGIRYWSSGEYLIVGYPWCFRERPGFPSFWHSRARPSPIFIGTTERNISHSKRLLTINTLRAACIGELEWWISVFPRPYQSGMCERSPPQIIFKKQALCYITSVHPERRNFPQGQGRWGFWPQEYIEVFRGLKSKSDTEIEEESPFWGWVDKWTERSYFLPYESCGL